MKLFACLLPGLLLISLHAVAAERIVSVGGAVTEIVYALDAGDRLVAVDSTSTWPPEAADLPDVGYMRQLSAEPIFALGPDLVLASETAGPDSALDQLRSAGVRVVTVPEEHSAHGVAQKIMRVAEELGLEEQGRALADTVAGDFAAVDRTSPVEARRPRVLFVMNAGRGAPMAAGSGTAAEAIIEMAGGMNAIEGFEGYKPLSPEAAVAAAPDVLLAMRETVKSAGGEAAFLQVPQLASTKAAGDGRLVTLDGLLLLGFGPRTPHAVRELAQALHHDPAASP